LKSLNVLNVNLNNHKDELAGVQGALYGCSKIEAVLSSLKIVDYLATKEVTDYDIVLRNKSTGEESVFKIYGANVDDECCEESE
jgi:hypothetical protein